MVAGAAAIPGPKSSNGNQPPAASRVDPPAAPAAKADEPSGWKETTAVSLTGWLPGSLAYAPDGKSLVIGGTNGHVRVIDAATRDVKWEKTLDGKLTGVAVSPDGKAVAATIKDGVQLFDAATGVPGLALEDKDSSPTAVGFFPDTHLVGPQGQLTSHKVVFGGEKGYAAKSWIDGGAPGTVKTSTSTKDSYAVPLAVDPNGQHAVMTGPVDPKTGRNVLWAYACGGQGGNHVLVGHGSPVVSAAWSADGKTIVTGDAVGIIIVWDAGTFKEKESGRFFLAGRVAGVAVSADGRRIAAALVSSPPVEQRVLVWTVGTKSLRQVHDELVGGPFQGIAGLAFSPDGTELAAGFCNVTHLSRSGRLEGKVRFWKLDGKDSLPAPAAVWKEVAFTGDHAKAASSLAVSPDGSTLVTGGFDNHVAVWDAATAKLRSDFQVKDSQGDGLAVAFRPDGKLIAVATRTSSVALYDPVKGNAARIDGQASWAGGATTLAFSPDGTKLAAMGGKVLRVIDTTKPGVETTRPGDDLPPVPTRPILTDLTWSADGKYFHDFRRVAKGGTWALTTRGADGEPKSRLHDTSNAITCLAQASDMESMAQGKADGTVAFSTAKNRSNGTIPAPPGPGSTVRAVRFTPDANKLAVVYDELDGRNSGLPYASSIRIYDLTVVGRFPELGVVTLKDRLVYDFATSADGTTIAVVSIDPADINSPKPKATDLRLWRRP
jgi:WD40 repeat protein